MQHVKFGDMIQLLGHSKIRGTQQDLLGFLSATGYGSNEIYLQQVQGDYEEDIETNHIINQRDFVYQLWPKMDFQAHKQVTRIKKEKEKLERSLMKQDQTASNQTLNLKQQQELLTEINEKLNQAYERCKIERELNMRMIDQYKGKSVLYGQDIFIMHVDSQSFLSGKILCSDNDQSAFKFTLSSHFSNGMVFRFIPKFKFRQEGQPIEYKDNILLFNHKLNCFSNFETLLQIPIDRCIKDINQQVKPYYRDIKSRRWMPFNRYECYLSSHREAQWNIRFFSSYRENEQTIFGGDIVKLQHSEYSGYLTADYTFVSNNSELYLRWYIGEFEEEQNNVSSLWEIEQVKGFKGSGIGISKGIKLRHFLTGKELSLKSITQEGRTIWVPCLVNDSNQSYQVVFHSTRGQGERYLENENCYVMEINHQQLCVHESLQYIDQNPMQSSTLKQTPSKFIEVTEDMIYTQLYDNELQIQRKGVICEARQNAIEENVFRIVKLSGQEKKDVLFVQSNISIINKFVALCRCGKFDKNNKELIRIIIKALSQLLLFVVKTDSKDAMTCEGLQIIERQRMLKDFRTIELIMDLLYYPFKQVQLEELGQVEEEVKRLFMLAYRLLRFTIQEYRPNEIYASQWLQLLLFQAKMTTQDGDIGAEDALTELIDNNKKILETKIDEKTIYSFLEMLLEEKEEKYVKMIKALCVCDGQAVIYNQGKISELILETEAIRTQLVYPLIMGINKIEISPFEDEGVIDLIEFEELSNQKTAKKTFKFFVEMIYLLSDLCLSRNYIAIDILSSIYPLNLCIEILGNPTYGFELRTCFTKLIQTLWIDRAPYNRLLLPDNVKVWQDIDVGSKPKFPTSAHDIIQMQPLKLIIKKHLERLRQVESFKSWEIDKNQFTLSVLELLKILVEFGFYAQFEEFDGEDSLINNLLLILQSIKDVTNFEEEKKIQAFDLAKQKKMGNKKIRLTTRYEEIQENQTIQKSKAIIIQVLQVINQLRISAQITEFLELYLKDKNELRTPELHGQGDIDKNGYQLVSSNTKKNSQDYQQEQVIHKLLNKCLEMNELSILKQKGDIDLSAILLDLTLYEQPTLVNLTLQFLDQLFSSKILLYNSLSDIQILEHQKDIDTYNELLLLNTKLSELVEKSEQWLCVDDQFQTHKDMINYLNQILLSLLSIEDKQEVLSPKLDEPDVEAIPQSNSQPNFQLLSLPCSNFNQLIIRNMGIWKQVLNLLEFDVENNTIRRTNQEEILDPESASCQVLRKCYQVLAKFCQNHTHNQKLMNPYIEKIFLKHLSSVYYVDLYQLLESLLKDNAVVLYNADLIQIIIQQLALIVEQQPLGSSYKSCYLQCFKTMTRFQKSCIKQNQSLVLNELTNKKYQQIFFSFSVQDMNQFYEFYSPLVSNFQKQQVAKVLKVQYELEYLRALFELMGVTCEEKNNNTESKMQHHMPLTSLMGIMKLFQGLWYFRSTAAFLFLHVYLETEREMKHDQMEQKQQILELLRQDAENMANSLEEEKIQYKSIYGQISMKYIKLDYFFRTILPSAEYVLYQQVFKSNDDKQAFITSILESTIIISQYLDVNDNKMRTMLKLFYGQLINLNYLSEQQLKQKIDAQLYPNLSLLSQLKISPNFTVSSIQRDNFLLKSSSPVLNNKQDQGERLIAKIEQLASNDKFIEDCQSQINGLIKKMYDIEEITDDSFKGVCTITFQELLQKMINFIDNHHDQTSEEQLVLRIKILRKIIENQVPHSVTPSAEWNYDDWIQYEKYIHKTQDLMVQMGLVPVIYKLFIEYPNSIKIQEEAVLLNIAMLLGGHLRSQQAFLNEMKNDGQNKFINYIKESLLKQTDSIKRVMTVMNKQHLEEYFNEKNTYQEKKLDIDQDDQKQIINEQQGGQQFQPSILIFTKRILRMLQLFCEGHYHEMQLHLQKQFIFGQLSSRSQDFVYFSGYLLSSLVKYVNPKVVDLGAQLIDLMIELIQGPCLQNQQALIKSKVDMTCKDFLMKFQSQSDFKKQGFITKEQIAALNSLHNQSIKLLYSLIEGNNQEIVNQLCTSIDSDFLIERLNKEYNELKKRLNVTNNNPQSLTAALGSNFDEQIADSFNLYHFLRQLSHHSPEIASNLKRDWASLNFYQYSTASIEVIFNGGLHRVYFQIHPICRFLSDDTRSFLMSEIPRDSAAEKIKGLIMASPGVFEEMEHLAYLQQLPFNFSASRLNFLRDVSTFLSLLINFLMVLAYKKVLRTDTSESMNSVDSMIDKYIPVQFIINIVGFCQLFTSSLIIVFYMFIQGPLKLKGKWREQIQKGKLQKEFDEIDIDQYDDDELNPRDIPFKITTQILQLNGPEAKLFNKHGKRNFGNLYTYMMYYWFNFLFIFGDGSIQYFFFYIAVSFAGSFLSEVAYCLHLLDIVNRFPQLQNVTKSITTNRSQLFLTSFLGVIIMYLYSLFAVYYIDTVYTGDVYDENGDIITENMCTNLLQCFLVTMQKGFILGGGIGDYVGKESFEQQNVSRYTAVYVFNLSFFIIIKCAFLNIIFGIILDTFKQLRDGRKFMEIDKKTVCFICGQKREVVSYINISFILI